ncbi:hypothetical protein [Nannocystis radixulma]|uniref:Uncharacterized protein n=1 Tax=Nannocystis radixulma TaxID=2995305 RepID=A0ABT5B1W2_9BACT|nr:hypothetical protein [Nannocystis radixulma]MDC0668067.1 hypothetical protein [Nannocystis radixulma]
MLKAHITLAALALAAGAAAPLARALPDPPGRCPPGFCLDSIRDDDTELAADKNGNRQICRKELKTADACGNPSDPAQGNGSNDCEVIKDDNNPSGFPLVRCDDIVLRDPG